MAKILVVDDERNIRATLGDILGDEGHEVCFAENGDRALGAIPEEDPDVVLLDIQLPRRDGLSVLEEIKKRGYDCEVIMISGHGTIESAVRAIKIGAYHFLQKPLAMIEVRQLVRHAAEAKQQRDELRTLRGKDVRRYEIVGKSRAVAALREQILKVAPTTGRVLITGESGTGKELVAWAIHRHSERHDRPFVKVNCAAIPRNLIESELFGHEKGAFTGATATKKGKFEVADRGTLLLDEIGDMDLNTQTKVLRAIQEGELERVGGTKTIKVDIRILAATHRDLREMIADGSFREDLYYRLCVLPVHVPPLAQRPDDIPLLATHFLSGYCRDNGVAPGQFTDEALQLLTGLRYRGNIRELRNIVERAAILSTGAEISGSFLRSLMEPDRGPPGHDLFVTTRPLAEAKESLERVYVSTQLEIHGWDIPRTASALGLQRTNLHRKIKSLGIERP